MLGADFKISLQAIITIVDTPKSNEDAIGNHDNQDKANKRIEPRQFSLSTLNYVDNEPDDSGY